MTIVNGAGVVVTGGGSGIGRAIARRLAADGARVVVNDLDAEAARAVAAETGGLAVPGDVGSEQGVSELIEAAAGFLGEIDIYCSNAGTGGGGGPEEDRWQRSWEVNVMGHVRAARVLLPGWLERGRGTFVVTASAAGLLTMLGAAPYSATKHAAVGYAEWLAATYAHRGLTVHCVCPQGVRTNMTAGSEVGGAGSVVLAPGMIEPEQVADTLAAALPDGPFLVLPHPEVHDYYVRRATDTDRWLRGMTRLQERVELTQQETPVNQETLVNQETPLNQETP